MFHWDILKLYCCFDTLSPPIWSLEMTGEIGPSFSDCRGTTVYLWTRGSDTPVRAWALTSSLGQPRPRPRQLAHSATGKPALPPRLTSEPWRGRSPAFLLLTPQENIPQLYQPPSRLLGVGGGLVSLGLLKWG